MLVDARERIVALALRDRIPAITNVPEYTDAGAPISYGHAPSREPRFDRTRGSSRNSTTRRPSVRWVQVSSCYCHCPPKFEVLPARRAPSVDTNHLLLTLTWIQITEGQTNKQYSPNHVSGGAIEQVVQGVAHGKGTASKNRHRERPHVGD